MSAAEQHTQSAQGAQDPAGLNPDVLLTIRLGGGQVETAPGTFAVLPQLTVGDKAYQRAPDGGWWLLAPDPRQGTTYRVGPAIAQTLEALALLLVRDTWLRRHVAGLWVRRASGAVDSLLAGDASCELAPEVDGLETCAGLDAGDLLDAAVGVWPEGRP